MMEIIDAAYLGCPHCRGAGHFIVRASDAYPEGSKVACGNCMERRQWEGLDREEQRTWCVWAQGPERWLAELDTREGAELEAARLARKHLGRTFIVFEKLVSIRAKQDNGDLLEPAISKTGVVSDFGAGGGSR